MTNVKQSNHYSIKVTDNQKVVIVVLEGFLDDAAGTDIFQQVEEKIKSNFNRFIFDFEKVRNVTSPVVAVILDLCEKITDKYNGKVLISGLSDLNKKIFEMVGVFLFAEGCSTRQEAEVRALM